MDLAEKSVILDNGYAISCLDNENPGRKTIAFIHGWGADKYNLGMIYDPLISKYRIISVDLPGFGKSPAPGKTIGSPEYAEILKSFFKKLNICEINYVGHSFGGKIGIILAAESNSIIRRLVLIDSTGIRSRHSPLYHLRVGSYKILKFFIRHFGSDAGRLEKLKSKFGSTDYKNAAGMRDILVRQVNEDFSGILKKIECPVFLYWGEKDRDTPLWMAKKMKRLIGDSALYVVKGGGHFSFLKDSRITGIIDAFV